MADTKKVKILVSRDTKVLEQQYIEFCEAHDVVNVAFFVDAGVMYYSIYYMEASEAATPTQENDGTTTA